MTTDPLGAAPRTPGFFQREADDVARDLLGDVVVSETDAGLAAGRIVEAEAYLGPHDPASHAAARTGRTARNAAMFGPPGTAYVYRIYGLHWCLNAVTGEDGFPAAVLIRALEPLAGIDLMRHRRATADRDLARGPGRLTTALAIDGGLDKHPLHRPPLRFLAGPRIPDVEVTIGPRIGVRRAADWPLRFSIDGSPWVSR